MLVQETTEENSTINSPLLATSQPKSFTIRCGQRTLLHIPLNFGVKRRNLLTYLIGVYGCITLFVFINAVAGYVLTNFLHIPQDSQGGYTGDLACFNELAILPTIILYGLISDRTGRMPVFVFAFAMMGIALALHSLARTWPVLIAFRVMFGIGASAGGAMITAVLADYPDDEGRGKVGGAVGLVAGLGALTAVFLFLRIPKWMNIEDLIAAGDVMFFVVAGFAFFCAIIMFFGLKWGRPDSKNKQPGLVQILKVGFESCKRLEILLAFLSSFAARGDSVVASTFISLWVHKYYITHGLPSDEGLAKAGAISGIAQTMAIVSAPFIGVLADKIPRVLTVGLCGFVGFIGYGLMVFVPDAASPLIYISVVLIGVAEIGMVISSQVLIAQEAPEDARGSLSGFFGIFASIGIITATKAGGILFDTWTEAAPFVMFSAFNFIIIVFALIVYIVRRHQAKMRI